MPEWLKTVLRPVYFRVDHWRGNPGFEFHHLPIVDIVHEYDAVYSYILDAGDAPDFTAGQYAHVIAPGAIRDNHHVRHMSFANAPHEAGVLFSMDCASASRFKRRFRKARPGDIVRLFKIRGDFTLRDEEAGRPVLFIAGGIGIAPIRSLIAQMDADGRRNWALVYAGRGILYRDFWAQFPDQVAFADRQTVFPKVATALTALDRPLVYLCGQDAFIADTTAFLTGQGIAPADIRTENFSH